jgi:hypothetical protein
MYNNLSVKFLEEGQLHEMAWDSLLRDFKKAQSLELFMEEVKKLWLILVLNESIFQIMLDFEIII